MPSKQQKAIEEVDKALQTYDTMLAVIDILKNMVTDHKQHAQKFKDQVNNPEDVQINTQKNEVSEK